MNQVNYLAALLVYQIAGLLILAVPFALLNAFVQGLSHSVLSVAFGVAYVTLLWLSSIAARHFAEQGDEGSLEESAEFAVSQLVLWVRASLNR